MLAKAPPPSISSEFRRNGPVYRTPLPFSHGYLHHRSYSNSSDNTNNGIMKWRKRDDSRALVVVRAGYTRRQMKTPGAYELIDEETGEKFIVWGGNDDDKDNTTSSIPSKDVLYWKPSNTINESNKNRSSSKTKSSNVISGSNSSGEDEYNNNNNNNNIRGSREAPNKRLAGSFGRLKAQRVKNLARATSSTKQDVKGREYEEKVIKDASFDTSIRSYNEPKKLGGQKKINFLRVKSNVSRANRSQEIQNTGQKDMTREDMELSVKAYKDEVEQLSKHQTRPEKLLKSDARVSDSRASAASFGGWSRGESMQHEYYRPTDISKKGKKLNADSDFFSRKSFRDLGCTDYMIESLRSRLFNRPSHVQAMAFAPVIEKKSCIIADQSGSGKTLAYLLPVIQRLRQEELQGLGKSLAQNPRVVILVPTAELASQVLSNCRLMSKFGVPFRSMVATGGFRQKTQLESLRQDLDVLIATPGRFTYLVKEGFLHLTNLTCAVLDEVDILYSDEDFEPALQTLMNSSPFTTQYLFVTATLPVSIYNKLVEVFPDCEVIMGPGMHRTSPGLEEILVDCSGDDGTEKTPDMAFLNKKTALLRLVEERQVAKTIVFCNKIETCRKVENVLQRFDRKEIRVRVLPFHAALTQESRLANMEEFRSSQSEDSSLFLVCTDRASRGIDFTGVDHVVLFDFPRDPSEYVRRVGRTARGAGGQGKAFIFVVGKQVSLARRIIERNMKGHPLHDVPAAYEQMR